MTPLAHAIAKELTRTEGKRTFADRVGLLEQMHDIHCFDVSSVAEYMDLVCQPFATIGEMAKDDRCFLPAPKTWVELKRPDGRVGILLCETCLGEEIFAVESASHFGSCLVADPLESDEVVGLRAKIMVSALLVINSPRNFGRRTHLPHRGLERDLLRRYRGVGKFPLRAWTDIFLKVGGEVEDESGNQTAEGHLTGRRCLHFVRAFKRFRLGRQELVKSCWRGDPALGTKRSRYILESGGALH
jgi:hypothetical protein